MSIFFVTPPPRPFKSRISLWILGLLIPLLLTSCGGGGGSTSSGGGNSNKTPKKTDSDNPLGDISATAGNYGERIITGEAATSSPMTGLNPSDADAVYVSADESICTVDGDTGAVTGVDEGECRITLTLSRTGYNDKIIEYVTSVILSASDFKGKYIFKGLFLGVNTKAAFADVDGDGDRDLVVGLEDGTLKYYQRNATDAPVLFTEQTDTDNPFNDFDVGTKAAPTLADIDGDGDQDLIVGESTGTLKYFLNESVGSTISFTAKTAASENPFNGFDAGNESTPTLADVDGDGDPDLIVGENLGTLKYFLNDSTSGTISFTAKTSATENPFNGFDVGYRSAPIFADIDGDNKIDLVVGEDEGTLKYYLNESTSSTISFTAKTVASENPFNGFDVGRHAAPAFFDIDRDGEPDLIVGGKDGILKYFLNESTSNTIAFTEQTETVNPFNGPDSGYVSTFADIDGDGDLDVVGGESAGTLKYYLNESTSGTLAFTPKTGAENPFNGFDVGIASTPTFADVDGDGDHDLVVGESGGTLKYFLNESVGSTISFTAKTAASENPFNGFDVGTFSKPEFADIDGDGDQDLVVGGSTGTLKYFLNESVGSTISFTAKTAVSDNPFNGFNVGTYSSPTLADIDGDGDQDLVVGESSGTLKYFLNESTGNTITFTEKTGANNPFINRFDVGSYSSPEFVDIDGDGDQDLIVGGNSGNIFTIFNHLGTWVSFR